MQHTKKTLKFDDGTEVTFTPLDFGEIKPEPTEPLKSGWLMGRLMFDTLDEAMKVRKEKRKQVENKSEIDKGGSCTYSKSEMQRGYFVKNPNTGEFYISFDEKDKYKD